MVESQVVGGCGNGDIRRWKTEDGRQQGPAMRTDGTVISQDGDHGYKVIVRNAATHEKSGRHGYVPAIAAGFEDAHRQAFRSSDLVQRGEHQFTPSRIYNGLFSHPPLPYYLTVDEPSMLDYTACYLHKRLQATRLPSSELTLAQPNH